MRTTNAMKIGMTFPSQLAVLDCETTGVDSQEARVVTCFIGIIDTATGEITDRWSWLVDPGIEIPVEASNVHGITTARAQAEGMDAATAIAEIALRVNVLERESMCFVIMNAQYDWTVLDRELLRHHPRRRPIMQPNDEGKILTPVTFDPMVFDRAIDVYRAGSRKLVDLAKFYGVPVEANAHDAEADCRMAGRVAIKLLGHSRIQDMSLSEVHAKLIPTKANQAISLARYWRDKALPKASTDAERNELRRRIAEVQATGKYWPMIPRPEQNGESE